MAIANRPPMFHLRPLTGFACVVVFTYVGGALMSPRVFPAAALTVLLKFLFTGSVAVSFVSRGATRVFWAAFASFGFAQCVALRLLADVGMPTLGYFHSQSLHEMYLRIYRRPFGSEFDAFASTVNTTLIIVIASIAASVCRAVYLSREQINSSNTAD